MMTHAWFRALRLLPLALILASCHLMLPISQDESAQETCGNGALDPEETCDPGTAGPVDGCDTACRTIDGWSCDGAPSTCTPICGDGRILGEEDCEGDPGEATCESTGQGTGTLTCSAQCRYDFSQCLAFDHITCGADHVCAVMSSGAVFCWGGNGSGQLGDGTTSERLFPVAIESLSRVTAIQAGDELTCAVSDMAREDENLVYCWGTNSAGGLGVGDEGLPQSNVPVSLPWFEALAPDQARGLGGMGGHLCAAVSDGTLACWGNNAAGQIGDGQAGTDVFAPAPVSGAEDIVSVCGGVDHSCALTGSGTVTCWGGNSAGQLGDGTTEDRAGPVAVEGRFESLSAGDSFTCGVTQEQGVKCWGRNVDGQLGIGSTQNQTVPVEVVLPSPAVRVSCGLAHACALLSTGEIACWGRNWDGQLGDGTYDPRNAPVLIPGLMDATGVGAGHAHTCATGISGVVLCWGDNSSGQLGDGTHKPGTPTPQPVVF